MAPGSDRQLVHVPIPLLWTLSVLLISFGLFPLLTQKDPQRVLQRALSTADVYRENATMIPFLTGFRDSTGQLFILARKKQAPVFYYGLHVLPAVIWSILMPLQHIDSFRKSRLALHVFSGRAIMICNAFLSVTGLLFPLMNLAWTHPDFFHLHTWQLQNGSTVFVWPSFASLTTLLGIATIFTGYKTWKTAKQKDIRSHRWWATVYTTVGYTVPLQRAWITVTFIAGNVLASSPKQLQRWFGVPTLDTEIWAGEMGAFAWTTLMAEICSSLWIGWFVWREQKGTKLS